MTSTAPIRTSKRVADALSAHMPVVALESTVVTHGLPRPRNLEAAHAFEEVVVAAGAVPATIGIIAGEIIVGLEPAELKYLAETDADKASMWNLASIVARGGAAGTTVAVTVYAAASAGIDVFATGGIGGVHDEPFDESADLAALANHSVLTVCAGPKNILNVAATLERLESSGVVVVGYRSDTLAGFTVPLTDLPVPARVDTPEEAAAILRAQRRLGLAPGVLLSNPVSRGVTPAAFQDARAQAQAEAQAQGVSGARSTPFLLSALARISGGDTLEANTRLLEENAALAARVAAALAGSRAHTVTESAVTANGRGEPVS